LLKVLFLGHCSYYTVSHLARAIKENSADVSITAADLMKPDGNEITDTEKKIFNDTISLPKKSDTRLTGKDRGLELISILKENQRRKIFFNYLFRLRLKALSNYLSSEAEEKIYSRLMKSVFEGYDVFHFQYVAPEFLTPLKYVDRIKVSILTFWGSDLFQTTGLENYRKQIEAFEKADLITINTSEMQYVFASKFGGKFMPKVRTAYFILSEAKFDMIDSCRNYDTISDFKKKYGIPQEKKILTIGYSASSKQKHVEILKILNRLDNDTKKKMHIVIPMTYGLQFESTDYLDEVISIAEQSDIGTTVLTEYIIGEDLTKFTIASEIKLNLRDSDMMNASLIESLTAGNIVINGAWLPYGKLRRLGVHYHEIEKLEDLTEKIPDILGNFESEKDRTKDNNRIIRKFFSEKNLVKDWIELYDEAKNEILKKQK